MTRVAMTAGFRLDSFDDARNRFSGTSGGLIYAGAYSFEAANARHEHEWRVWEDVQPPDGKLILPGIVSHSTNVVEHPELVAERIERFAGVVGRENLIASTDCGLGGRIHAQIAWAKLEARSAGAAIASDRLWSWPAQRAEGHDFGNESWE